MTLQAQTVLNSAIDLPPVERAGIIEQLLASFDLNSRRTIDEFWASEAESRLDAFGKGEIASTDLDLVRERINSK